MILILSLFNSQVLPYDFILPAVPFPHPYLHISSIHLQTGYAEYGNAEHSVSPLLRSHSQLIQNEKFSLL